MFYKLDGMPIIIQNRNQDVFNYVNCVLKVKNVMPLRKCIK